MVDSRETGERSGLIPWIRQCVLFRHHVPPRDRATAFVLSSSLMLREGGLRQHVSAMNVTFMALLCVNVAIRQTPGLRLQVPLHLVVATSRRFIYSACNHEKTGVSLCEPFNL